MLEVEVTTVVDRSVTTVWDWYAVHHVQNHPRWDPDIKLEQISEGPIGVGTVIKRHVSRFGNTTEGTMEILEFKPKKAMRAKIRDGSMAINGRALFEAAAGTRRS